MVFRMAREKKDSVSKKNTAAQKAVAPEKEVLPVEEPVPAAKPAEPVVEQVKPAPDRKSVV